MPNQQNPNSLLSALRAELGERGREPFQLPIVELSGEALDKFMAFSATTEAFEMSARAMQQALEMRAREVDEVKTIFWRAAAAQFGIDIDNCSYTVASERSSGKSTIIRNVTPDDEDYEARKEDLKGMTAPRG